MKCEMVLLMEKFLKTPVYLIGVLRDGILAGGRLRGTGEHPAGDVTTCCGLQVPVAMEAALPPLLHPRLGPVVTNKQKSALFVLGGTCKVTANWSTDAAVCKVKCAI